MGQLQSRRALKSRTDHWKIQKKFLQQRKRYELLEVVAHVEHQLGCGMTLDHCVLAVGHGTFPGGSQLRAVWSLTMASFPMVRLWCLPQLPAKFLGP